jgi:hypothetical protein
MQVRILPSAPNPRGHHMADDADFMDELLNMARQPGCLAMFEPAKWFW